MNKPPVIALLGQPNSGKSTIFNMMTGSHQHVGNWPGKTVDQKEGEFRYNGKQMILADLPGSYSLSAGSDEEIITKDYITSGNADLVLVMADASQLKRSLNQKSVIHSNSLSSAREKMQFIGTLLDNVLTTSKTVKKAFTNFDKKALLPVRVKLMAFGIILGIFLLAMIFAGVISGIASAILVCRCTPLRI